jgi:hypothetical protein
MSTSLNTRAMLASLTIHRWQATLTDKKVSRDIAQRHDVSERRAGKYRKYAINVESPSFKATNSAASNIRHEHYWLTLPWGQDGARILTAAGFETYSAKMRQLRSEFEAAAEAFALDYPALHEAAKIELNGLYDPKDYPRDVRAKFGIELSIMPLPDAGDFRAELSSDAVAEIRSNIEQELARTTSAAMRDPYERLHQHISRMVNALKDPKGIFRDSLVTGLAELCNVLPALNLTNDQQLESLRMQAEGLIAGISAEQLRDVPSIRSDVAQRAQAIQDVMAGFMGAQS